MVDLNAMRKHAPVITVAQYLKLHGLPTSLETSNGQWDSVAYHNTTGITTPSLAIIPQEDFDQFPVGTVRVDRLSPKNSMARLEQGSTEWEVYNGLLQHLINHKTMSLDVAANYIKQKLDEKWKDESELIKMLEKYGFGVVHTYSGL